MADNDNQGGLLIGLLLGAIGGSIYGLLNTRRSGEANRLRIQRKAEQLLDTARRTVTRSDDKAQRSVEDAISGADEAGDRTRIHFTNRAEKLRSGVSHAADDVRHRVAETADDVRHRVADTAGDVRHRVTETAEHLGEAARQRLDPASIRLGSLTDVPADQSNR